MHKKIILASQSPRRRELIALLKMPFQVIPSMIEEDGFEKKNLETSLRILAKKKVDDVYENHKDALVIGADTIVVYNGDILEKPKSQEEAVEMLQTLSGQTHEVWTSVSMKSSERCEDFMVKSRVEFYDIGQEELEEYIATGEPMDKAGGYNINGYGSLFVKKVEGDHFAIMGLPISKVYQKIKKYEW